MLMLPKGKGNLWYWSSDNFQSLWYQSIDIYRQLILVVGMKLLIRYH